MFNDTKLLKYGEITKEKSKIFGISAYNVL